MNYNNSIPNGYFSNFGSIASLGEKSLEECIFKSSKVEITTVQSPVQWFRKVELISGNEKIDSLNLECSMNQLLFELSCSNINDLRNCNKNELTLFLKYYVIQSVTISSRAVLLFF